MPIYEYRCRKCERSFEAFVRSSRDEVECPSCHGTRLTRELSVFASGPASRETGNGEGAAPAAKAPFRGSVCCGGSCGCR